MAKVQAGSSVAIVGLGHLGQWMVQAAKLAGARRIIAVDPIAYRREMAGKLGATDLVDPAVEDPVEQVKALTEGRGADYVLEAATLTSAQAQAITIARRAGTMVLTGVERAGRDDDRLAGRARAPGPRVLSGQNGNVRMRRDLPRFVRMLEDGWVDAEPIITHAVLRSTRSTTPSRPRPRCATSAASSSRIG